ncbi:MAG: Rne/Rng family ribonuclease [Chlorobi bacterium]|nr:Rne/Rng family ribonuclease [Chlorobiota bacterium]
MSKDLVIDASSAEINIALLEDKELVELNKEASNTKFSVGDIYLGRVKKIMPGLNAAFIDVGYERDAFLHYLDLGPQFNSLKKFTKQAFFNKNRIISLNKFRLEPDIDKNGKIANVLSENETILVQIAKEPISTKGPRLASEISIAGRNLVLIPFSDKVSISQKIHSLDERIRLKKLLQSIKPKNYGIIVRTVAESKKVADLDTELRQLVKKWESAFHPLKAAKPPRLFIGELNRTSAILRDMLSPSFNSIIVNNEEIYHEIKDYLKTIAPEKQKIVKKYSGKKSIFDHYGIIKQIKAHFGKTVAIKKGAYLIIEHTEALHVIDVNSGNRTQSNIDQESNALDVNLAAAQEISRQLRLRDMGGIIVIDFIDMIDSNNKQLVYEKMKETMVEDRAKHHILPLSKFGLMQITRQRVRPEMNIKTIEVCPTCKGKGEINPTILFADELESHLSFVCSKVSFTTLILKVHPIIAAYLTKGMKSIRLGWFFKFRKKIRIVPVSSYSLLEYHFFNKAGEKIML